MQNRFEKAAMVVVVAGQEHRFELFHGGHVEQPNIGQYFSRSFQPFGSHVRIGKYIKTDSVQNSKSGTTRESVGEVLK